MNCWEFMECGREQGGVNAKELGICPAYPNDGTRCAHVAGTFCRSEVQGTFAMKHLDCTKCVFYNSEHYEGKRFMPLAGNFKSVTSSLVKQSKTFHKGGVK